MGLMPRKFYMGDDFFEDFFEPTVKNQIKCDVYEKNGVYYFEMDAPGYEKEEINIECDKGYLNITFEKNEENNEENKKYIRRERYYGKYNRSFYVGDVDVTSIEAKFDKGTLFISVPKKEEEVSKKNIEIK